MYQLKRIIAYAIDMALVYGIITFLMPYAYMFLAKVDPKHVLAAFLIWPVSAGIPIAVLGTCTGIFGRTPGKLICFLKVVNEQGSKLKFHQGILREILKYIAVSFFFGAIWALYDLFNSGRTFYDSWIGTDVEDLKPAGLTETQKRWREFNRNNP